MPESDLIQQLDQAVDAMLRGETAPRMGPEVTALVQIAGHVRALPDGDFRASLKALFMDKAVKLSKALKEKDQMTTATATVNWIPKGFHTLTPYLHAPAEAKIMDFLRDAFGAVEKFRVPTKIGTIMHAQAQIGDSIVEVSEIPDDYVAPRATSLRTYVQSVDETYRRALAAGATSLYEPVDQSYGDREAGIKDPAGNVWFIARPVRGDNYKHPGLQDVAPYFFPHGAAAFIEFLQKAFGAETIGRHESPEGLLYHASLKIGDSIIGMGEAREQWPTMPGGIHYYIPNVDEVYERALAAGAKSLQAPVDQPYGDRYAGVIDSQGNYWYLATHIKDVEF
jgi:PhnB protein